jgi:hypothetical protein
MLGAVETVQLSEVFCREERSGRELSERRLTTVRRAYETRPSRVGKNATTKLLLW